MTAEQAIARFRQQEARLLAKYGEANSGYYGELLDAPMDQFNDDLLDAGLEPGTPAWWEACCQVQLECFMGGEDPEALRERHELATNLVAKLRNPTNR